MGNCYPESSEQRAQKLLLENELKLTMEFRKTIEDIYFKNIKQKILRTDEEIMAEYKLMGELGSGYFSNVYLVSDTQGKLFALKVIKKQKFKSKENIQKILVEKLILKALKHENILKLYKTIQSKKNLYFFLEYASKGNLLSILNQKYKLKENEIRIIAAQMIKGLLHIHSQGIIYGDLKAENILVNEKGLVKFCDFNLAGTKSFLDDQIQGTQSYLAPEIIEKKPRTKKSDFWALGVLLYLLNYRCYPFVGKSQTDLFYNIVNRNFNEKTKYKASSSLKQLLGDLLRKDINRRLGNNLQEFIHHPYFNDFQWGKEISLSKSFLQSVQTIDEQLEEIRQSNPESAQIPSLNNKFLYEIEGFTFESETLQDQNLKNQKTNQQIAVKLFIQGSISKFICSPSLSSLLSSLFSISLLLKSVKSFCYCLFSSKYIVSDLKILISQFFKSFQKSGCLIFICQFIEFSEPQDLLHVLHKHLYNLSISVFFLRILFFLQELLLELWKYDT